MRYAISFSLLSILLFMHNVWAGPEGTFVPQSKKYETHHTAHRSASAGVKLSHHHPIHTSLTHHSVHKIHEAKTSHSARKASAVGAHQTVKAEKIKHASRAQSTKPVVNQHHPLVEQAKHMHKQFAYHHQHHRAMARGKLLAHGKIHEENSDTLACLSKNAHALEYNANGFDAEVNQRLMDYRSSVCAIAEAQLGKPYRFGLESPASGFDCSGLSQFVYAREGIEIPRTALEQYHSLAPVQHLQEGDLVFFRTRAHSRLVSHVGIYIGEGYFVHSPRTGEHIRVDRLADPYWHQRYAGARRVLTASKLAEANLIPDPGALGTSDS